MRTLSFVFHCSILAIGMLGCSSSDEQSGAEVASKESPGPTESEDVAPAVADPAKEAQKVFESTCAVCHGTTGRGDGAGAASLDPKPRDFTDMAWQQEIADEEIKKTIVSGGMAVGKSPVMPATPQLKQQPEVLEQLVALIRDFGQEG